MKSSRVVMVSSPYPLLDPGEYVAFCREASLAWARQWKKWIARLAFEPQTYSGRSYQGTLCKFLSLGTNPEFPYAGPHSAFRLLYVEANGGQPMGPEVTLRIFEGLHCEIRVETVTKDRHGKERRPEHWYSIIREVRIAKAAAAPGQHSNTPPSNLSTEKNKATNSTDQHSNPENPPLTMSKSSLRGQLEKIAVWP